MTAQDIFDAAVERSNLNDAALVSEAEWVSAVSSYQHRIYLTAARENPDFFGVEGTTAARGSYTGSWSLATAPGNVAAVSRVEVNEITGSVAGISVGDEVSIISIRSPEAGVAPRAYIRSKTIYPYNSELSTDASNFVSRLKIFYSYLPSTLSSAADTLATPDEFKLLLVLPLARFLALRDQRPDDAAAIDQEFSLEWQTFLQHLSVFDEAAIRELQRIPASFAMAGMRTQTSGQ